MIEKSLQLDDSRRLTGPNIFGKKPGAVIDVLISHVHDKHTVIDLWVDEITLLLKQLGWENERVFHRHFQAGASMSITAPIDCLYAATEVNEAAWDRTVKAVLGEETLTTELMKTVQRLQTLIQKQTNLPLRALQAEAKKHGVPFLSDDDHVSVGYGATCQVFAVDQIPDVTTIDWSAIQTIPLALVTGTNGKSTTVRLAAAVMKAAGLDCGVTSTDYIRIGDQILDTGDYSGPGGARTVLRHPYTQMAVLEVARGGMLRRGLGVNEAKCAAITNVAADHLGDYGMDSVGDMLEAKFIIRQALSLDQDLILNADDSGVVTMASNLKNQIVWFSWSADNPVIEKHINYGGKAVYVDQGVIYYHSDKPVAVIQVSEIPITMNGVAKHNTHNALLVVAIAHSFGIALDKIKEGLKGFDNTPENNPGRGNLFEFNGFQVLVDFAHNEHGLSAMTNTINGMKAKRKLVMIGQAGDRSDQLIGGLVKAAMSADPDCLVICELAGYLRGRNLGEIPRLIENLAIDQGLKKDQIIHAGSSLQGAQKALDWACEGDILLLLSLSDREKVIEFIQKSACHP